MPKQMVITPIVLLLCLLIPTPPQALRQVALHQVRLLLVVVRPQVVARLPAARPQVVVRLPVAVHLLAAVQAQVSLSLKWLMCWFKSQAMGMYRQ